MTRDPWAEFARAAHDRPIAGYFERGDAPGLPGRWAASFTHADEHFTLLRGDRPESLDRFTARRLRGDARRGIMGYVTFEAAGLWEPLLAGRREMNPFPLGEFAVVDHLVRRRVRAVPRERPSARRPPPPRALEETLPARRYARAVRRLHRAIGDGDAFQVVLANRRRFHRPDDLLARAALLRARERFAYFYYLRFGDREVVGASPESVVEVEHARAHVYPIAGTLPAGDRRRGRRPLAEDSKELSEHRMLVDLARNDLGKIATTGSVRVAWREREFRFARLTHLISRVDARVRPGVGPWAVLAATFPAGTVSGAPKIRATQLLRQEEQTWRGPYAGAVGLLTGDGRTSWALAIRGAFTSGRDLYTCAGAGIVWASRPAREFREVRTKLSQLEATLVGGSPG